MITCCTKGSSKQSRLNKRVSCNRPPDKRGQDNGNTWINISVVHKAIHACSIHSMEDYFAVC